MAVRPACGIYRDAIAPPRRTGQTAVNVRRSSLRRRSLRRYHISADQSYSLFSARTTGIPADLVATVHCVAAQRNTWAETLKGAAGLGLMLNILALPAVFGVLAATDHWYLAFLA